MKMKLALVTGGAGFLGMNLVEQLLEAQWNVRVLDRDLPGTVPFEVSGVEWLQGDIADPAAMEQALPERVDAVFHVAGDTTHWRLGDARQTRVNVEGTRVVAAAALKRKARRFIHTSSIAAYGFHPGRITEEAPSRALESRINYFRTKRLAELEVHRGIEQGLDAVILNPANIIGAYDRSGWSRLFPMVEQGRLPGAPPALVSFCHAREVARAHVSAQEKGRTGHHYLLGGADATFFEFAREIGRILGRKVPRKPTPAWVLRLYGRLSYWGSCLTRREPDLTPEKADLVTNDLVCSSEKAEKELDYHPASLTAMLEDCHLWLVKEGLLP